MDAVTTTQIDDRLTDPTGGSGTGRAEAGLDSFLWVTGLAAEFADRYPINADTAMCYAAVFGCVRVILNNLAVYGWGVYERSPDRRGKIPVDDDTAYLLHTQPNPEMSSLNWREALLKDAALRGNGYAEIERDPFGRIRWMWPIKNERVSVDRYDSGQLVYVVDNGRGVPDTFLPPENVFHLRGMGDGVVGLAVIEHARKSIQLGMDQEGFGSSFFRRGPMPGGVLKMPGAVKKEDRDAARESFERAYGGAKNAGRTVVLSGGMEWAPAQLPNTDAQWLESQSFSVAQVCRFFGVPPHMVAELGRATFSNIEHQNREFYQNCALPWARRLESEADIKLFGRINRGRKWTKINLAALLRGDSQTHTDRITKLVVSGVMTPNEGREELDLNPKEGGDELVIQGAMVPLARILAAPVEVERVQDPDPPEPPTPETLPAPRPAEARVDRRAVAAAFRPLFQDAYERLLRVEADKAKRAENRGQLASWADEFYKGAHAKHVSDTLRPVVAAALLAAGDDTSFAEGLAAKLAVQHCNVSLTCLRAKGVSTLAAWDGSRAVDDAVLSVLGVKHEDA